MAQDRQPGAGAAAFPAHNLQRAPPGGLGQQALPERRRAFARGHIAGGAQGARLPARDQADLHFVPARLPVEHHYAIGLHHQLPRRRFHREQALPRPLPVGDRLLLRLLQGRPLLLGLLAHRLFRHMHPGQALQPVLRFREGGGRA